MNGKLPPLLAELQQERSYAANINFLALHTMLPAAISKTLIRCIRIPANNVANPEELFQSFVRLMGF